jgi:hypothetical protein
VKEQHRKELQDLTQSFLAQRQELSSDDHLRSRVEELQRELEEERSRHKAELEELGRSQQLQHQQLADEQQREEQEHSSQDSLHSCIEELRRELEQERSRHKAELEERHRLQQQLADKKQLEDQVPFLPKVTNIGVQIFVITDICNLQCLQSCNFLPIFSGMTRFLPTIILSRLF